MARIIGQNTGLPPGMVQKDPYSTREGYLEREYNRLLIERGFSVRRSSLKKLDRIDVRGIYSLPQNKYDFPFEMTGLPDELETAYMQAEYGSSGFLHCILPCFSEGILQLNANLELHWKVLGTDTNAQTEDAELRLYHDEGFGWAPTVVVRARITAPESAEGIPFILHAFGADALRIPWEGELPGWDAVHHAIPVQDLPWNEKDKLLWQEFIERANLLQPDGVASLVEVNKDGDRKETEIGQAAGLAKIWTSAIVAVNILLWARTHARKTVGSTGWEKRGDVPDGKEKTEEKQGKEPEKPSRIVRTVGGIALTSERPPRRVTAKGARNYKVAEWKRRGHPRHYKSGRVVWIEESTARRRAAKVADTGTLPVTIRVNSLKESGEDHDK